MGRGGDNGEEEKQRGEMPLGFYPQVLVLEISHFQKDKKKSTFENSP